MNPCECTDTREVVICALNRADGPCLTTAAAQPTEAPEPSATPEPPALNSDALTASLMTALSSKITL